MMHGTMNLKKRNSYFSSLKRWKCEGLDLIPRAACVWCPYVIHGVLAITPPGPPAPQRSTTCRLWTTILRGRPVHVVIFQQQYTLADWRLLIWKSHIRSSVVVTSHWPSCIHGNKTLANIILLLEVYSLFLFWFPQKQSHNGKVTTR